VHKTFAFINLCKFVQRHVWCAFHVSAAIPGPNRCKMCTWEACSARTMPFFVWYFWCWSVEVLLALWRFHAWVVIGYCEYSLATVKSMFAGLLLQRFRWELLKPFSCLVCMVLIGISLGGFINALVVLWMSCYRSLWVQMGNGMGVFGEMLL